MHGMVLVCCLVTSFVMIAGAKIHIKQCLDIVQLKYFLAFFVDFKIINLIKTGFLFVQV